MTRFTLTAPPPGVTSSSASGSLSQAFAEIDTAIPCGREALVRLGGVRPGAKNGRNGGDSEFDMEKIVIPVGITPKTLKNFNLYQILGMAGELGASADIEVIKKAYHKAVLMYHPDKAQFKTEDGKEDRCVFLKIQEAFNVLTNQDKRRAYDSQLPFDETIPTEEMCAKYDFQVKPQKFFKLFDPVFKRNARFAVVKPVPELGDPDTPMTQVLKFYDYWNKYSSWRDFTGVDAEYKPDDASSREEKRYMQKENEKKAKKKKEAEYQRIIALVGLAEKKDPRLVRDKLLKQQSKEAEKQKKEDKVKREADFDKDSRDWSEALEAAASAKKGGTKEEKEKIKKAQSEARNTFRKLLRATAALGLGEDVKDPEYGRFTGTQVDLLCNNVDFDGLTELNDSMGGKAAAKDSGVFQAAGITKVLEELRRCDSIEARNKEDELIMRETKKRETEERNSPQKAAAAAGGATGKRHPSEREWTDEQVAVLSEAIHRYRPGAPIMVDSKPIPRWTTVANFVNYQLIKGGGPLAGGSFSPDECLIKAFIVAHPDRA